MAKGVTDPWRTLETERVLETPIFSVNRRRLVSPRTEAPHDFFILECCDWVNVVPLTKDGHVVMVRQHRHGIGTDTLELPGGLIDPHDPSPLEAARRELR